MSTGWDVQLGQYPLPPKNPMAVAALGHRGALDLRWDDPNLLSRNTTFTILGVNIYRSDVSDRGPFFGPINEFPLGGGFYRDRTGVELIERELVTWDQGWRHRGDGPNARTWVLTTRWPIVKNDPQGPFDQVIYASGPHDVVVWVNDVRVPVDRVLGRSGEVKLVNQTKIDPATLQEETALWLTADDVVEVDYFRHKNFVRTGLDQKTFYRMVTVALDPNVPGQYLETPLEYTKPVNAYQVEEIDWIWKEAIRRNHFMLQQGGERVKLFIRRTAGVPCACQLDPQELTYRRQPLNSCRTCYGTGYVGGFEGPYDILLAPDMGENRIDLQMRGLKKEKTQDVWMTTTPLVTQRDFIIKLTGERFSIGPVTRQTVRGAILQQHFNIGHLDETDIRYVVPIDGTADLIRPPQTRYAQVPEPLQPGDGDTAYQGQHHNPVEPPFPTDAEGRWPEVTNKDTNVIPEDRQIRGRTAVWENTES